MTPVIISALRQHTKKTCGSSHLFQVSSKSQVKLRVRLVYHDAAGTTAVSRLITLETLIGLSVSSKSKIYFLPATFKQWNSDHQTKKQH